MKQMDIPGNRVVEINYENADLSRPVKELRPVVWVDEQGYSCILGPDPQEGIIGTGSSVEAALADWEQQLKERVRTAGSADELAQYVIDTLRISKADVW
jgi:hypothetical protein